MLKGEKRFHGKLSEEYHLHKRARPHWDELDRRVAAAVAAFRAPDGDRPPSALELGCGTGCTTAAILRARPSLRLCAVDNEEPMIAQARENLRDWVRSGELRLARADALAFLSRLPRASVDIVATKFTLHNLLAPYRSAVLRVVLRALTPGGLLVNADKYAYAPRRQARELRAQLDRYFDVLIPLGKHAHFAQVAAHYMEDEQPGRVLREREGAAELRRLGFTRVRREFRRGMDAVYTARAPR